MRNASIPQLIYCMLERRGANSPIWEMMETAENSSNMGLQRAQPCYRSSHGRAHAWTLNISVARTPMAEKIPTSETTARKGQINELCIYMNWLDQPHQCIDSSEE